MRTVSILLSLLVLTSVLVTLSCAPPTPTSTKPATSATLTQTPTSPTSPATSKATSPATSSAPTTTAAPVSFAGKTISIIVGTAPGGGLDTATRFYARFLPKFLPGNPAITVRNMPGGGGTTGPNYFWNTKPDGLTLMTVGANATLPPLLNRSDVRYDLTKLPAFIAVGVAGIIFAKPSVVDKPENILQAKGMIYGGSGSGSGTAVFLMAKELLGIPTDKLVLAYEGSGDARRAFLSGEINTTWDTGPAYTTALKPYADKGEMVILYQTGLQDENANFYKAPVFPSNILTLNELHEKIKGKAPSGLAYETYSAIIAATVTFDFPILPPPGTPDNIVKVYMDACDKMVKDPEFLAQSDKVIGEKSPWISGQSAAKAFKASYKISPEGSQYYRDTLRKYGVVVE